MRSTLSVIIITKNEASNLEDCLQSVVFADEIVVVDGNSTDGTQEIARLHGAKIVETQDWPGFGPQKNRALALASKDWVLSIDADERVSQPLASEILNLLQTTNKATCYAIPRKSWYCGRFMQHSGWSPDYVERLFVRGTATFSDDQVHEKLIPTGTVVKLNNHLLHYSFRDFSQVLKKVDFYSTLSAQQYLRQGKRGSLGKAIGHGIWAFARTYFFRLGFMDGAQGLALAISNAEGTYYRYAKLWQMGLPKE